MPSGTDYEKWYRLYYMEVYSFAMAILRSREEAEEAVQETFFRAMKGNYRGEASERTYLCAIAKNVCADMRRRQAKFGEMPEEIADGKSVEAMLDDKLTTLRIHRILHDLEEPYKEVFSLRVFGELSFREIGTIFGKTENWARVTYHRARLKIQERM